MLNLVKKLDSILVLCTVLVFFGAFHATLSESSQHINVLKSKFDLLEKDAHSLHGPLFLDGDIPDQESGLQKARVLRKIKRQATTSLQYLQFISMQVRTIHSLCGNGFESIYPSNNLDRIKKSFICGTPPPCFV